MKNGPSIAAPDEPDVWLTAASTYNVSGESFFIARECRVCQNRDERFVVRSLKSGCRVVRLVVVAAHRNTRGFFLPLPALRFEHLFFRAARAPAFLPPDARDLLLGRRRGSFDARLDLVQQEPAREKAVERLRALLLAFDPNARRPVMEDDARRSLINFLATGARGAYELLLDVLLADAERLHALNQRFFFAGRDDIEGHVYSCTIIAGRRRETLWRFRSIPRLSSMTGIRSRSSASASGRCDRGERPKPP